MTSTRSVVFRRVVASVAASAVACAASPYPPGTMKKRCESPNPDGSKAYLVRVPPEYPAEAHTRGAIGHVVMEFALSPLGEPSEIVVIESVPSGLFDQAAMDALAQWRYCPTGERREAMRVRLDFAL